MSQAIMIPHVEQGKITGFSVQGISPDSIYKKMGLQNGDIIRTVSGQAVGNQDPAMQIYQAVEKTAAIELEVMRDGAVFPVYYVMPN